MDNYENLKNKLLSATARHRSFYTEYISRIMPDLPADDTVRLLDRLCMDGALTRTYETVCPNDSTVLAESADSRETAGSEIYCRECGTEIHIDGSFIRPKYYIGS